MTAESVVTAGHFDPSAKPGTSTAAIEEALGSAMGRLPPQLVDGCRQLVRAGGKRLRPELVIRCAEVGANGSLDAVDGAVAVELLHSASLVHDDLLDDSNTRRGLPSLHRSKGPSSAILAGDALIALSWQYVSGCGADNSRDLGAALSAMCEGQALEEELTFRLDPGPGEVLRVARLKTGALLETACRIGARLGGCTPEQTIQLGRFGRDLGIELQLLDDVLDLVSDDQLMGKPTGNDFRSGLLTMPTVFAAEGADAATLSRLRELFAAPVDDGAADEAKRLVIDSGAAALTIDLARVYAARAAGFAADAGAGHLVSLPDRYLQSQLTKATADHRAQTGTALRAVPDSPFPDTTLAHWETERAG